MSRARRRLPRPCRLSERGPRASRRSSRPLAALDRSYDRGPRWHPAWSSTMRRSPWARSRGPDTDARSIHPRIRRDADEGTLRPACSASPALARGACETASRDDGVRTVGFARSRSQSDCRASPCVQSPRTAVALEEPRESAGRGRPGLRASVLTMTLGHRRHAASAGSSDSQRRFAALRPPPLATRRSTGSPSLSRCSGSGRSLSQSKAIRTWAATARASGGGTAFPIWRNPCHFAAVGRNQSGMPWRRAASRTETTRSCSWWMGRGAL